MINIKRNNELIEVVQAIRDMADMIQNKEHLSHKV